MMSTPRPTAQAPPGASSLHSRQVVPPSPDICPQCSLVGLFTAAQPKDDKKVSQG